MNHDGGELTRRCLDLLEAATGPETRSRSFSSTTGRETVSSISSGVRPYARGAPRKEPRFRRGGECRSWRARRRRLRRPREQRCVRLSGLAPPARGCARERPHGGCRVSEDLAGRPVRGHRYRRATAREVEAITGLLAFGSKQYGWTAANGALTFDMPRGFMGPSVRRARVPVDLRPLSPVRTHRRGRGDGACRGAHVV